MTRKATDHLHGGSGDRCVGVQAGGAVGPPAHLASLCRLDSVGPNPECIIFIIQWMLVTASQAYDSLG